MSKTPKHILYEVKGIGNNAFIRKGEENIKWMLLGAGGGFVIASYYRTNKWIGMLAGSIIGAVGADIVQNLKPNEKKE